MICTRIGIKKLKHSYRQVLLSALVCAVLLPGCKPQETVTDYYYIQNDLEEPVSLVFANSVAWDMGTSGDFVQVWYDSICPDIPANKGVRLHPICRKSIYADAHKINPGHCMGSVTKLIVGADTITWKSDYGHMFADDTTVSIYNVTCWTTVKDPDRPNTYHSTFTINKTMRKGEQK